MEKIALCVSSLNGQWKAVALRRSAVGGQWECPEPVREFSAADAVIRESASRTRANGRGVAVVLSHAQLSHHVIEVPPAKGWALQQFLERRASSLKTYEGPAAWSAQPALPTRNGKSVLIHLCPQAALDQLASACRSAGLELVRVLPAPAVLAAQLRQLPLEKDEVALLAAETGGTTTVVVGRKDGQVCLARTILGTWDTHPEQLGINLARTIGYGEQQSGVVVRSVWLFGATASAHQGVMTSVLKRPVQISPVAPTPYYWAEQAGRLPAHDDGNLLTPEVVLAPHRRRLLTATGVILGLLFLASLGAAAYMETWRRNQLRALESLKAETARLQERKNEWQARYDELALKKDFVKVIKEDRLPPVAAWYLAYMGTALPDEMLLTDLRVARASNGWRVRMEGVMQPGTNPAVSLPPAQVFQTFSNRLATGPFRVQFQRCELGSPAASPAPPGLVRPRPPSDTNHFLMEGVMQ